MILITSQRTSLSYKIIYSQARTLTTFEVFEIKTLLALVSIPRTLYRVRMEWSLGEDRGNPANSKHQCSGDLMAEEHAQPGAT